VHPSAGGEVRWYIPIYDTGTLDESIHSACIVPDIDISAVHCGTCANAGCSGVVPDFLTIRHAEGIHITVVAPENDAIVRHRCG